MSDNESPSELISNPRKINMRVCKTTNRIYISVMCPSCSHGGATWLNTNSESVSGYQPNCSKCSTPMMPASNSKPECSWEEMLRYIETMKRNQRHV